MTLLHEEQQSKTSVLAERESELLSKVSVLSPLSEMFEGSFKRNVQNKWGGRFACNYLVPIKIRTFSSGANESWLIS